MFPLHNLGNTQTSITPTNAEVLNLYYPIVLVNSNELILLSCHTLVLQSFRTWDIAVTIIKVLDVQNPLSGVDLQYKSEREAVLLEQESFKYMTCLISFSAVLANYERFHAYSMLEKKIARSICLKKFQKVFWTSSII